MPQKVPEDRSKVAVSIIVLAAFTLLLVLFCGLMGYQQKGSREKPTKALLVRIDAALDQFKSDTGRYPTTAEGVQALVKGPPGLAGWDGPYVERDPRDEWGSPILYKSTSPVTYVLFSAGKDRKGGTEDDLYSSGSRLGENGKGWEL